MSAHGYKRTCGEVRERVRFTPQSGHSEAQEQLGLKERTLDVCFTPRSGHKWLRRWMSAYDPKRTFGRPSTSGYTCALTIFWFTGTIAFWKILLC